MNPPGVPAAPMDLARIVVRMPAWLGDVVMARGAVEAIARLRPQAEIVAECLPPYAPFVAGLPGVARVEAAPKERGPRAILAARRRFDALAPDAVVCLPRSLRAAVAPALARVPVRVGFGSAGTRRLLTHAVEGWRPWRRAHRSTWFQLLARAFGPLPDDLGTRPATVPDAAREAARRVLLALGRRAERPLVVLEPGAAYGTAKCWPVERYADLAARLDADGHDVAVVGTAATRDRQRAIVARAPRTLAAVGRTPDLGVLAGVLVEAAVVVSNDTGPMHLAAALGVPVVALFGASDPDVSRPVGPARTTVLFEPEPCSPCFLRTCPVPGHPCLARISTARVLEAVAAGES